MQVSNGNTDYPISGDYKHTPMKFNKSEMYDNSPSQGSDSDNQIINLSNISSIIDISSSSMGHRERENSELQVDDLLQNTSDISNQKFLSENHTNFETFQPSTPALYRPNINDTPSSPWLYTPFLSPNAKHISKFNIEPNHFGAISLFSRPNSMSLENFDDGDSDSEYRAENDLSGDEDQELKYKNPSDSSNNTIQVSSDSSNDESQSDNTNESNEVTSEPKEKISPSSETNDGKEQDESPNSDAFIFPIDCSELSHLHWDVFKMDFMTNNLTDEDTHESEDDDFVDTISEDDENWMEMCVAEDELPPQEIEVPPKKVLVTPISKSNTMNSYPDNIFSSDFPMSPLSELGASPSQKLRVETPFQVALTKQLLYHFQLLLTNYLLSCRERKDISVLKELLLSLYEFRNDRIVPPNFKKAWDHIHEFLMICNEDNVPKQAKRKKKNQFLWECLGVFLNNSNLPLDPHILGIIDHEIKGTRSIFMPAEDWLLASGIELYGTDFGKIAANLLPGKTEHQVTNRVRNITAKKSENNPIYITLERRKEKAKKKLLNGIRMYGEDFKRISQEIFDREEPARALTLLYKEIEDELKEEALHSYDLLLQKRQERQRQQEEMRMKMGYHMISGSGLTGSEEYPGVTQVIPLADGGTIILPHNVKPPAGVGGIQTFIQPTLANTQQEMYINENVLVTQAQPDPKTPQIGNLNQELLTPNDLNFWTPPSSNHRKRYRSGTLSPSSRKRLKDEESLLLNTPNADNLFDDIASTNYTYSESKNSMFKEIHSGQLIHNNILNTLPMRQLFPSKESVDSQLVETNLNTDVEGLNDSLQIGELIETTTHKISPIHIDGTNRNSEYLNQVFPQEEKELAENSSKLTYDFGQENIYRKENDSLSSNSNDIKALHQTIEKLSEYHSDNKQDANQNTTSQANYTQGMGGKIFKDTRLPLSSFQSRSNPEANNNKFGNLKNDNVAGINQVKDTWKKEELAYVMRTLKVCGADTNSLEKMWNLDRSSGKISRSNKELQERAKDLLRRFSEFKQKKA